MQSFMFFGCGFAVRHARRAVGSLWKVRSKANAKPIRQCAKCEAAGAPPSPPRSGFVQQVAGADRRWRCQFRCRGSRHESAVAQLSTLALGARMNRIGYIALTWLGSLWPAATNILPIGREG